MASYRFRVIAVVAATAPLAGCGAINAPVRRTGWQPSALGQLADRTHHGIADRTRRGIADRAHRGIDRPTARCGGSAARRAPSRSRDTRVE
jgi:hypothetical protein